MPEGAQVLGLGGHVLDLGLVSSGLDSKSGFSWLLAPATDQDDATWIPLVNEVIYSDAFVHSNLDRAYFLAKMNVNATQISTVVQQTVSQWDSPLWHI